VDLDVTGQGGVAEETFSADDARQRFSFVRPVDSHMTLKIPFVF
jgi:hypothetical protein